MTTASPRPTSIISRPLFHALSPVTTVLAAPIRKCARVLITNEAITAVYPPPKKKGMIGMKAPNAVDRLAEMASRQGLGSSHRTAVPSVAAVTDQPWYSAEASMVAR